MNNIIVIILFILVIILFINDITQLFSFKEGFVWIRFPLYALAAQAWLAKDKDVRIFMLLSMFLGMMLMCIILTAELIISPKPRLMWPFDDTMTGAYITKVSLPLFCILSAIALNKTSKLSGYISLLALIPLVYLFLT